MDTESSAPRSSLDIDVSRLKNADPHWLVSIDDPLVPEFRCPPSSSVDPFKAEPARRNDTGDEIRIRATIRPEVEGVTAGRPIRVEIDVDSAYPGGQTPRMFVRSVLSGYDNHEGRVSDSFFLSVLPDDKRRKSSTDCNLIEKMLEHFASNCMKHAKDADLRFKVGDHVLANVGSWKAGTIVKVWDRGFPYRINLHDDGEEVFAPHDSDDVVRSGSGQIISGYGDGPSPMMPRDAWASNVGRWQKASRFSKDSLDKELFVETMDTFPANWLSPEVAAWLDGNGGTKLSADFVSNLSEGVYAFPLFSPEFCGKIIAEYEHCMALAESEGIDISRPNSMNRSGAIMCEIGMESLIDCLQDTVLAPLAKNLFPIVGEELSNHHSFLIKYTPNKDVSLDMHTDDSDVTFNICLGKHFTGSGLQFCGQLGTAKHRHQTLSYQHRVGWCVSHLGSRRHGADNITSGERINLIVWNRNKVWRRSSGYLHRVHQMDYEKESGPPDPVCVSWTHDVDWEKYHGARPRQGMRPWCPPAFAQHDSSSSSNSH